VAKIFAMLRSRGKANGNTEKAKKRRQTQIWPPARRVSRHAGARLGPRLTLDKNDGNAPGVVCTQEI
jgi:hypothetical protein